MIEIFSHNFPGVYPDFWVDDEFDYSMRVDLELGLCEIRGSIYRACEDFRMEEYDDWCEMIFDYFIGWEVIYEDA